MEKRTIVGMVGVLALAGVAVADQDVNLLERFEVDSGPYQVDQPSERGTTLLYSRITETGSRFNPGLGGPAGGPATQPNVVFDDVPIPSSRLAGNTSIAVTRVTVGIRRLANAPATDVSIFWATSTTGATLPDTELDVPFNSVGAVSLGANGAASVTQLITIGDGSTTLFTAPLNTTLITPDFATLLIGVQLSNVDPLNGWRLTSGLDANANVGWMYDTDFTDPESRFNFGTTGPVAAFYIELEGTPVPTPGSLALIGFAGIAAARRRR
jgi:MYXO-CTERM domain-containing protein